MQLVDTMAADDSDVAPCIAKSSATMILTQ